MSAVSDKMMIQRRVVFIFFERLNSATSNLKMSLVALISSHFIRISSILSARNEIADERREERSLVTHARGNH
jgi:hypothetical protein